MDFRPTRVGFAPPGSQVSPVATSLQFLPLPPAACRVCVVLVTRAPSRADSQGCAQRNPHLAA